MMKRIQEAGKGMQRFGGRMTAIGCGALALICVAVFAFSLLTNKPETEGPTDAQVQTAQAELLAAAERTEGDRCVAATEDQIADIEAGFEDGSNITLSNAWTVRSSAWEPSVFFVAAVIHGPGFEDGAGPALWARLGDLDGLILSVNAFATEFSNYPDASTTDVPATQFDDGAPEAIACAEAQPQPGI